MIDYAFYLEREINILLSLLDALQAYHVPPAEADFTRENPFWKYRVTEKVMAAENSDLFTRACHSPARLPKSVLIAYLRQALRNLSESGRFTPEPARAFLVSSTEYLGFISHM